MVVGNCSPNERACSESDSYWDRIGIEIDSDPDFDSDFDSDPDPDPDSDGDGDHCNRIPPLRVRGAGHKGGHRPPLKPPDRLDDLHGLLSCFSYPYHLPPRAPS
jgi:hypothetical protein